MLAPSSNLLSLHLSDNGIRASEDLLYEVLDTFDIQDESLDPKQLIQGHCKLTEQAIDDKGSAALKGVVKDHFKSITESKCSDFKQQMILIEQCRQVTKSRYEKLPSTKSGIGGTSNLANSLHLSEVHHSAGHQIMQNEHSGGDAFVVTRSLNHSELIFNQHPLTNNFFDLHGADCWQFSLKGDCYICDKHRYSLIFFDQTKTHNLDEFNEELVEIYDRKQVNQIKEALYQNSGKDDDKTPIICGSVINDSVFGGDKANFNFKRKLKMLRADIFSLLSVSLASDFVITNKQSYQIQKGVISVVENQTQNLSFKENLGDLNPMNKKKQQGSEDALKQAFCQRLIGWEYIMKDFCIQNQITDLAIINLPHVLKPVEKDVLVLSQQATITPAHEETNDDKKETLENAQTLVMQNSIVSSLPEEIETLEPKEPVASQVYAYAQYLTPGLHQFIIYCPKTDRAFIKQVVIDINGKDYYPEYPYTLKKLKRKPKIKRKDVWKTWKEDTPEMQKLAVNSDMQNGCEPERFVKDPDEIKQCKEILEDHFQSLNTVFLGMSANSDQYPEIDYNAFLEAVMAHQQDLPEGAIPLTRAQVELAFQSATRNDKAARMKGALCRGEFFEVLLRLALVQTPKGGNVSDQLPIFVAEQMEATLPDSEILNIRRRVRGNAAINNILWDNKALLQKLYNYYRQGKRFTHESIDNILKHLNESDEKHNVEFIGKSDLTRLFRMSQMSVARDKRNSWRYSELAYVEFLELFCRSSIHNQHDHGFPMNDEEKIQHLIETLHSRAVKANIIDPELIVVEPMAKMDRDDSD